jgi:hypothetical protein
MQQTIQNFTFSVLKMYSVKELDRFKVININGDLRVFTSKGEINFFSDNDKHSLIQIMGNNKILYGVFSHIEVDKHWNENIKTIHTVVSFKEDDNLKDHAVQIVNVRQQKEQERKIKEEERRIKELERQKEIESLRKERLAQLKIMEKERREKAEQIKLNNRIYMTQVITGEIKPKSVSIIDVLLSPFEVKRHRHTHCFDCKKHLDSDLDIKCTNCGWLLCRCGACGCTYGLF